MAHAGCAAAVDPRGYFLTAAHCIEDKPVYLVFIQPGKVVWAQRARVVWRPDLKNDAPDLALLHVSGKLDNVFEWSEDPHASGPVMAVGLSLSLKEKALQGYQHMGGKILGHEKRKGEKHESLVLHDIPLQSGDSGGPLVDAEARLVGINVRARPPILRFLLPGIQYPRSEAERPDGKWLAEIIEKDSAETGENKEATYFAVRYFFVKIAQTIGIALFAMFLLYGKEVGNDFGIRLNGLLGFGLCLLAALIFTRFREKREKRPDEHLIDGESAKKTAE